MKKLDFQDRPEYFFEIVYDGIIGTSRGFAAPNETRLIGNVLNKLDAISAEDTAIGGLPRRKLKSGGGAVLLEQGEYNLVKEALATVKWNATASRRATEVVDWFSASPDVLGDIVDPAAKKEA